MAGDLPPPINGTEQRLDVLIDELRAWRAEHGPAAATPTADGMLELREPQRAAKPRKGAR